MMRKKTPAILLIFSLLSFSMFAQVEKVIVETYYVSDSTDATDTTGGTLEAGSKTYRIYVDLAPGCRLRKLYGDVNHALKISSTADFFNNRADGQSFGKDIAKNRYGENTVALDSWLTLGQTTRSAAKTYFGIMKPQDRDGSFVGGIHNDGGSSGITSGLLAHADPLAGIPLTTSDGMDTMTVVPGSWGNYGITDMITGVDSTIFGSVKPGTQFISNNAGLQNSGVTGVIPDSNQVLVAQLTTKGEISFELNIEVEQPDGSSFRVVQYVADGTTLVQDASHDEHLCAFLKYPQVCGCMNAQYLEYSPNFTCSDSGACQTPVVFGCMDTMACNFDPFANFHIESLCCYPGHCNDRDIAVVCPSLKTGRYANSEFRLFPNPVAGQLTFQTDLNPNSTIKCAIYDSMGRMVYAKDMGMQSGSFAEHFDVSGLEPGIYGFRYFEGEHSFSKTFIKY